MKTFSLSSRSEDPVSDLSKENNLVKNYQAFSLEFISKEVDCVSNKPLDEYRFVGSGIVDHHS